MNNHAPAGFWIRALATLIDAVFFYALIWIIALLIKDEGFMHSFNVGTTSTSEDVASLIYNAVFVVIFTASRYKGSPGKLICRIQVVNTDMSKISLLKSIGRYFAYVLSLLSLFIGFMMAGWNAEKKALHDMLCKTRVVYRER
ncbi:RDD family protein [Virgibacillus sp. C22-A2]|uniref:RDD family protein n=1 Tax=Virgibacillus tibetensis TaxID=3042313 RepID=A0ABU6KET9_9BACI|nr:RDD family protein [Virgibacillus sp. C22-A2]